MADNKNHTEDFEELLIRFNEREVAAFGEVYSLFYDDLFYYTVKLYIGTHTEPQDVVHDTFLKLWQHTHAKFKTMVDLKAYLFIIIRNEFNQFYRHRSYVKKYEKDRLRASDDFEFDVVESELRAYCSHILRLLPNESAEIMRLFFDGFDAEEIALQLGKNKQTVYNKKSEAIRLLKSKLGKENPFLLFLMWK